MLTMTIPNFDLKQIADSGQCFRMTALAPNRYQIIARDRLLIAEQDGDTFTFDCSQDEFDRFWTNYFDLNTDYSTYIAAIPEDDAFLQLAAAYGNGIRILRQDPWEMLITFILSQRKSIPAIKTSVEALCRLCGTPLDSTGTRFAFPTPEQLSACTMQELQGCSLGYRTRYIFNTAARVSAQPNLLDSYKNAPNALLQDFLLSFQGVGSKVSSCVMLFGYHRINAFPLDVWMNRVISIVYGDAFPLELYDGFAGVIQQYMFYYGRNAELLPNQNNPINPV